MPPSVHQCSALILEHAMVALDYAIKVMNFMFLLKRASLDIFPKMDFQNLKKSILKLFQLL